MLLQKISTRSLEEKVILQWTDVKYSVFQKNPQESSAFKTQYKEKNILKGVSGMAETGQLLAIMGPTGCGKTSLLNVLAARVPNGSSQFGHLRGDVKVNGEVRNEENFRRLSAYVLQDDVLYAHLTVRETLLLAAHFFLSAAISTEDKEAVVKSIIKELGLVKVTNSLIGGEKRRGISGGERKRCAIGAQLIVDPAVLFLDEPTSGLDSFQAQSVMECMKGLSESGRLVISVIHQPRSSIFIMFDRLLLLSEGQTMFEGLAAEAVDYFRESGYTCPDDFNPADFFLDVLSPDNRTPSLDATSSQRIEELAIKWQEYHQIMTSQKSDKQIKYPKTKIQLVGESGVSVERIFRNFMYLCWRTWTEASRNRIAFFMKLGFSLAFALLLGGIYSGSKDDQKSIQNRLGLLFFVIINQAFTATSGVLNVFPREKIIVNRERSARAYDTVSYFFAKFLVELPLNVFPALIYGLVVYWLAGLNPHPAQFVIFFLVLMLSSLTAIALGLFISSIMPSIESASAVGPLFLVVGIIFGGFYIQVESLPPVAEWIPNISLFYWGLMALCVNEFTGLTFTCDGLADDSCIRTGEEMLDRLGFHYSTGESVLGLWILLIVYFAMSVCVLHYSGIKYIPLGFQGKKSKQLSSSNSNVSSKEKEIIKKDETTAV
mmetsp:Transcript_5075/g.5201  ORF Transcript_5075/g.5201 Transcript_5075/m.5201 type:complete len:659 (-) Transcript_5075:43-2019(-)